MIEILSWDEKHDILQEAYEANSNAPVYCYEFSFCGSLETVHNSSMILCHVLNLVYPCLRLAVREFHEKTKQPQIQGLKPLSVLQSLFRNAET